MAGTKPDRRKVAELVMNNGLEAVVQVAGGPVKQVYLKRLVRQDETGIWPVVGYDPR